jgi:DNA-binding GntR family transcriptional regulator
MTKSPNRADQAYLVLKRAIIDQALKPGEKLPEDEVGSLFSMSRTLVRQVFGKLSNDGLIKIGGKRPATVVTPSLEDAVAAFQVRRALEREVIRLVSVGWNPQFHSMLTNHVNKEAAAAREGERTKSIRLAGEFHILLAELSGNTILCRYVSEIVTRCSIVLAVFGRPHSAECGVQEHTGIIQALDSGDVAAASALMDHHIGEVESRALISSQQSEQPSLAEKLQRYTIPEETGAKATSGLKGGLRVVGSSS